MTREMFMNALDDIIADNKKIGWINLDYEKIHIQFDPRDTKTFSVDYDNVGFWLGYNNSQVYIPFKLVNAQGYGFDERSDTYVANFSNGYFSFTVY